MTKDELSYCRGCAYLSKTGSEPTCDYLDRVGHSRGCAVGEGCPHHTGVSRVEAIRKMSAEGKTDKEIGEALGISQWVVTNLRNQHQIRKKRGGNHRPPKKAAKAEKPKIEQTQKTDIECPVAEKPVTPAPVEPEGITLGEFLAAIKALLPEKLNGGALYIDGTQVKELYGYSVTMPDGKLTVDLFTTR